MEALNNVHLFLSVGWFWRCGGMVPFITFPSTPLRESDMEFWTMVFSSCPDTWIFAFFLCGNCFLYKYAHITSKHFIPHINAQVNVSYMTRYPICFWFIVKKNLFYCACQCGPLRNLKARWLFLTVYSLHWRGCNLPYLVYFYKIHWQLFRIAPQKPCIIKSEAQCGRCCHQGIAPE